MITLLMFGCLLTVGCHKEESYDMQIYYLNSEETALNTEGYNLNSDKAEDQVEEVLKNDPGYYSWIMNGDFPLNTKKILTEIKLRGFNSK